MTNLQLEFQLKELKERLATAETQIAQQQKQIDELRWATNSRNDDGPDTLPDWA
jgi:cell division septum initiation protein DivIVA